MNLIVLNEDFQYVDQVIHEKCRVQSGLQLLFHCQTHLISLTL